MMQEGEIIEASMVWRTELLVITNRGRVMRFFRRFGGDDYVWQEIARMS